MHCSHLVLPVLKESQWPLNTLEHVTVGENIVLRTVFILLGVALYFFPFYLSLSCVVNNKH